MPANPNWARWCHASVATILKAEATAISVPVLIEGIDERSAAFMESPDRIEVRVNGPFTQELSAGYHRLLLGVNVLVSTQMGPSTKRAYRLNEILGRFHSLMDGALAVYRFGTGPDDDSESLLGCLTPRPGKNNNIRVIHFGQLGTVDRLKQGMVDVQYVMYLNE